MKTIPKLRKSAGFSLIEVMIAIVVLSFGLLALAALQSGLFRAGAETKARANATEVAQQALEDARTYAFTAPPTGYAFNTYSGLATSNLATTTVGGVTYKGCVQVRRFVYDGTSFVAKNTVNFGTSVSGGNLTITCSDSAVGGVVAFDPATPEFKEVRVAVAWIGETGQAKSVQITDTIAAIAPADSAQVLKTPTGAAMGPKVYIVPPNQGNPGVVPIAIGTSADGQDIAAASSNPKPEQFVKDVSSVTTFNVQTFTGDQNGAEVLLNRQISVAAASCVCSDDGAVSTATSPAFQPTVWNGKQQAYMEPDVLVGKKVASAVIANADSETTALCTACCRDHHDNTAQAVKVDPYRADTRLADGDHQHYGYLQSGSSYDIASGLKVLGSLTGNHYEESCRLVRVNGRMRLAVDAAQNHLAVTPLNSAGTGFRNSNFVTDYSNFVSAYITELMAAIPTGYPGPSAQLAAPSSTLLADPRFATTVQTPATISLTSNGQVRKTVNFGLYIDYLNQDTRDAYTCALNHDDTGSCKGFGTRNPLEFIPFYAVNVANLGAWESSKTDVATVSNVQFSSQGSQTADGGVVTAQTGYSNQDFPVTSKIKNSNSGLTGTAAIDPDDGLAGNLKSDAQAFQKQGGASGGTDYHYVYLKPRNVENGINNLRNILSISGCSVVNGTNGAQDYWKCQFDANSVTSLTLTISGFTTKQGSTITDRQICLPSTVTAIPSSDGSTSENVTFTLAGLGNPGATSRIVPFDVNLDSVSCASGLTVSSTTP